jgi:hypothetical protein
LFVVAATGAPDFAVVAVCETDDPVAGVMLVVAAVTPVVVPVGAPVEVEVLGLDVVVAAGAEALGAAALGAAGLVADDPVAAVVLVVAAVTPVVVPVDAPVEVEGLSLDVTGAGVVVVVVEAFDTLLLKLVVL